MPKPLLLLFAVLFPLPVLAADLGAPKLSPPLSTARFFDPDRLLTSGGVRFSGNTNLTLEPELGLGYRAQERELPGVNSESIHKVHARAGWRLSFPDLLYLSAAAKLPVFTYEATGRSLNLEPSSRQSYDFGRPFKDSLSWTGEFGIHLSRQADLTLFYDRDFTFAPFPGQPQQEQRLGTRFIWRFK